MIAAANGPRQKRKSRASSPSRATKMWFANFPPAQRVQGQIHIVLIVFHQQYVEFV